MSGEDLVAVRADLGGQAHAVVHRYSHNKTAQRQLRRRAVVVVARTAAAIILRVRVPEGSEGPHHVGSVRWWGDGATHAAPAVVLASGGSARRSTHLYFRV
jgi:hypothetical protein